MQNDFLNDFWNDSWNDSWTATWKAFFYYASKFLSHCTQGFAKKMKPTFLDVLCTAQYALLPFISHAKALQLSSTCRLARGIVVPMLWLCRPEGRLLWLSGHEASFLDGDLKRAKYSDLCGIAVQKNNSILLSDSHNNVLRRLNEEGASILTSRLDGPRGMYVDQEHVYVACDKGIYLVSIQQPEHCTILRHLPRFFIKTPGTPAPFFVCKVGLSIYIADFSSTLYHWTPEDGFKTTEFPGSVLAGMCSDDANALLICDYGRGRVLRIQGDSNSIVFEYPRVRCIAKHHDILYATSESSLIEIRPKRTTVFDLDIGIKALAITKMGTPIIATFSQVFAVI